MAAGPIFLREALTTPRRLSHYVLRSGFVAGLLVLLYSLRQATVGFQDVLLTGDVATFSAMTFQIFTFLQLTLGLFFSTVFSASIVAQEKDRRTLILLLMTDLRNYELAVGKLLASLLNVIVLLATSLPVYCILKLLGGVTWSQIFWSQAIVASAALAAGSWGCLVAFWRDKTFQTLAISVLGVVLFILVAHAGRILNPEIRFLSPYFGLLHVVDPVPEGSLGVVSVTALPTVLLLSILAAALSTWTIIRLRVWNPSRELRQSAAVPVDPEAGAADAGQTPVRQHRHVWNQPVIWREMRTRAYGRRMIWIKLAYVLLALAVAALSLREAGIRDQLVLGMVTLPAFAFLGIGILSLLLTNAQAVTSLTNERDGGTLDILLVTNIKPHEFIAGKIGGALWNAREMIILPLLLLMVAFAMGRIESLTFENLVYVTVTWLVLCVFAVTLGLHAGLSYHNSRQAIAHSLGTMFFLFLGIFIFMLLLVEARSSFAIQLQSFILFIGFGSLGLYSSLTHRNPSNALTLAALGLPFLTFYAITEFLVGGSLGVGFWICLAYGFTAIAMMVPVMTDFDMALGRNTGDVG